MRIYVIPALLKKNQLSTIWKYQVCIIFNALASKAQKNHGFSPNFGYQGWWIEKKVPKTQLMACYRKIDSIVILFYHVFYCLFRFFWYCIEMLHNIIFVKKK